MPKSPARESDDINCVDSLAWVFELHTQEVIVPPDNPAGAHGLKIVERQLEIQWHDWQILDANAGTIFCDVPDAA